MASVRTFSFTLKSNNGLLNVLKTHCHICEAFDPNIPAASHPELKQFNVIWDTGATSSVITQNIVDECGLQAIGMARVQSVSGSLNSPVYLVNIMLPNNIGFPHIRVTRGVLSPDVDMLIGMDLITQGDFSITNKGNKTIFSFRCPSIYHVDFVKQGAKKYKNLGGGGKRKNKKRRKR